VTLTFTLVLWLLLKIGGILIALQDLEIGLLIVALGYLILILEVKTQNAER
jgi:hypothetical protein